MASERPNEFADLKEWRAGAEKGDPVSQFNLGLMYDEGLGVEQDYVRASLWYRKAALKGLADAQNNLGIMYDNGFGVPQDPITAFQWFQRAAEKGHADAQYNLGVMYESGRGVVPDMARALAWYHKAALHGHEDAKKNIRTILADSPGPKRKAQPSAAGQDYLVQLGSVRSRIQAEKESMRMAKAHGAVLKGLKVFVVQKDLGNRGTFYRLRVGPVKDRAAAERLCLKLSGPHHNCLVTQH